MMLELTIYLAADVKEGSRLIVVCVTSCRSLEYIYSRVIM